MISISDIEKLIEDHMKAQPYDCICAECGEPITLDVKLDGELDMIVQVPPCDCTKQKLDE